MTSDSIRGSRGLGLGIERSYWEKGMRFLAGVDEAGRGPLAGPVVAAAVMMKPGTEIEGVEDSKLLTPTRREELFREIMSAALSTGVGVVSHSVIDRVNILRATMQAMAEAVSRVSPRPEHILVDGPAYAAPAGSGTMPFTPIIGGDRLCFSIAAASIVAKVTRDRMMVEYDSRYPGYGFAQHKGYGTPAHLAILRELGPCEIHRRSFRAR